MPATLQLEHLAPEIKRLFTTPGACSPIFRPASQAIIQLIQEDKTNALDVSRAISQDPLFAASVIKAANSPAYNPSSSIVNLNHAVTLLGFDLILSMALATSDHDNNEQCATPLRQTFTQAFLAANQARSIGEATHYPGTGSLFTHALFYSLGEIILAFAMPEFHSQWREAKSADSPSLTDLEKERLGAKLNAIASALAQRWRFPESIIEVIERQPLPSDRRACTHADRTAAITGGANLLSQRLVEPASARRDNAISETLDKLSASLCLKRQNIIYAVSRGLAETIKLGEITAISREFPTIDPPADLSPAKDCLEACAAAKTKAIAHIEIIKRQPAAKESGPGEAAQEAGLGDESLETRDEDKHRQEQTNQNENIHAAISQADNAPKVIQAEAAIRIYDFLHAFTAATILHPIDALKLAMDGLESVAGFSRAILLLLTPKRDTLETKIARGSVPAELLSHSVKLSGGGFPADVLRQSHALMIDSQANSQNGSNPNVFLHHWGGGACLAAPILVKKHAIGVLLADRNGQAIAQDDCAHFTMIHALLNASLAKFAT